MNTKLYLISEDVDLGYHVSGVYDNRELAETKLIEFLNAWVENQFFGEEVPEDLKTRDGLLNYNGHHHYIIEEELNNDKSIDEKIEGERLYLKRKEDYSIENEIEWYRNRINFLESSGDKYNLIGICRDRLINLEKKKLNDN